MEECRSVGFRELRSECLVWYVGDVGARGGGEM